MAIAERVCTETLYERLQRELQAAQQEELGAVEPEEILILSALDAQLTHLQEGLPLALQLEDGNLLYAREHEPDVAYGIVMPAGTVHLHIPEVVLFGQQVPRAS